VDGGSSEISTITKKWAGGMENFRQLQFCNGCNVCVLPWELAGHSCVRQRVLNGRNNHTLGHVSWYTQETGTCRGTFCLEGVKESRRSVVVEANWVDVEERAGGKEGDV